MPRNYGEGRTCQNPTCSNPLKTHQKLYCCARCAIVSNRNKGLLARRINPTLELPTDDEIWFYGAQRSWVQWAALCHVSESTIKRHMNRRGWGRKIRGGITRAPCKTCGEPFDTDGDGKRVCASCEAAEPPTPTLTLYRQERARRMEGGDRWHLMWRTARPYVHVHGYLARRKADRRVAA